jgi:hypothetical protein
MKPLDLSFQPAASGDETVPNQQQYTNGAAVLPRSIFPGQIVVSSKLALTVVGIIASTIIGGGWMLSPAKDRDLQDLKKEVVGIGGAVNKLSTSMDLLTAAMNDNRVEIVRLQGLAAPAAQRPPVVGKRKVKAQTDKPAALFGGF